MAHKICPRCGEQYAALKSATCPQCFAKLVQVDEDTAGEMAAARAAIEQTPEFHEAKAQEDERFRHESFQACLALIAMGVGVGFVVILAVVIGLHARSSSRTARMPLEAAATAGQTRVQDVMPSRCGTFIRIEMDQRAAVSGTVALIYHAAYRHSESFPDGVSAPRSSTGLKVQRETKPPQNHAAVQRSVQGTLAPQLIDVYAWPINRPPAEQARFRSGLEMAAEMGGQPRSIVEINGRLFRYEIVGPATPNASPEPATFEFVRFWKIQVGGLK